MIVGADGYRNLKFGLRQVSLQEKNTFNVVLKEGSFEKHPHLIKYIKDPGEDVQLAAVLSSYKAIKYIENPSEDVQLISVRQQGIVIKRIKNPTLKVQEEAVKNNSESIRFIKNPGFDIQSLAFSSSHQRIREEMINSPVRFNMQEFFLEKENHLLLAHETGFLE